MGPEWCMAESKVKVCLPNHSDDKVLCLLLRVCTGKKGDREEKKQT